MRGHNRLIFYLNTADRSSRSNRSGALPQPSSIKDYGQGDHQECRAPKRNADRVCVLQARHVAVNGISQIIAG